MKRVNRIIEHPLYRKVLQALETAEKDRIFCKHDMEHFLDVARLAYIYSLEAGANLDRELLYAAALLHDTGRYCEYERGIPHEEAGVALAEKILPQCGFVEEEVRIIAGAVSAHRTCDSGGAKAEKGIWDLKNCLYRADKKSRLCFCCKAQEECNWKMEKRNMKVER